MTKKIYARIKKLNPVYIVYSHPEEMALYTPGYINCFISDLTGSEAHAQGCFFFCETQYFYIFVEPEFKRGEDPLYVFKDDPHVVVRRIIKEILAALQGDVFNAH